VAPVQFAQSLDRNLQLQFNFARRFHKIIFRGVEASFPPICLRVCR
jgi:hypothetical protein